MNKKMNEYLNYLNDIIDDLTQNINNFKNEIKKIKSQINNVEKESEEHEELLKKYYRCVHEINGLTGGRIYLETSKRMFMKIFNRLELEEINSVIGILERLKENI